MNLFIFMSVVLGLCACRPAEPPPAAADLDGAEILLRLRAREDDARRWKARLEADTRPRWQADRDADGLNERLTAARLAVERFQTADPAVRDQARADARSALDALRQFMDALNAAPARPPRETAF